MASVITATTTSGLTQSADNSGVLQLASGTGNLVTVPSVTGTAMVSGNMPAFSAYLSANQTVTSGTFTKIQFNTELFDTASAYDNTTNYRFTPTVAGYYQICLTVSNEASLTLTRLAVSIYKNGTEYSRVIMSSSGTGQALSNSQVIYLNGSTDYVEGWGISNAATAIFTGGTNPYACIFSGSLVRAA
jgi:hypothetical protein